MQLSKRPCPNSNGISLTGSATRKRTTTQRPGATLVLLIALSGLFTLASAVEDVWDLNSESKLSNTCHADCLTCYARQDASACMSCKQPDVGAAKYMTQFTCNTDCQGTGEVKDPNDFICKKTITAAEFPCPPTTYNSNPGQTEGIYCISATSGKYVETYGATDMAECVAGHFCATSSAARAPVAAYGIGNTGTDDADIRETPNNHYGLFYDEGAYTVGCRTSAESDPWKPTNAAETSSTYITDGSAPLNTNPNSPNNLFMCKSHGDVCAKGTYCYSASYQETPCDAGKYCPDRYMKVAPSSSDPLNNGGSCIEGFYCFSGNYKPVPGGPWSTTDTDDEDDQAWIDARGAYCSKGKYCEAGVTVEADCSIGKFNPHRGAFSIDHCYDCPTGKYCGETGLWDLTVQAASGDCTAGYFCQLGASIAKQSRCPYDFYCLTGTTSTVPCDWTLGKYTPSTAQDSCSDCGDGNYCQTASDPPIYAQTICPAGRYCTLDRVYACPWGTYNLAQGLSSWAECDANRCGQGYACLPFNKKYSCAGGYYCDSDKATTPKPSTESHGGYTCQPGYYCASSSYEQTECNPGKYCSEYMATTETAQCYPGYFCPSSGTTAPIATIPGYNQFAYPNGATICPSGNYCVQGSESITPCEPGTYNPHTGAGDGANCLACPEGYSCGTSGMDSFGTATCDEGFYCSSGSSTVSAASQSCDLGHACPGTLTYQVKCLAGYYQDELGSTFCKPCDAGYYCDGTDPTTKVACANGFWCAIHAPDTAYPGQGDPADSFNRGNATPYEHPCPAGTIGNGPDVAEGSKVDEATACTPCIDGTYCQYTGQTEAEDEILAGWHANTNPLGTAVPNPYKCPQAAYCAERSYTPYPCPNGYMTADVGSTGDEHCIPCPRGRWCNFYNMMVNGIDSQGGDWQAYQVASSDVGTPGEGTTRPDEDFEAWRLISGNASWKIKDLEDATGTTALVNTGFTMKEVLDRYYGLCDDGYICLEGATYYQPTTIAEHGGYRCPVGHQCPSGAVIEEPCPPGYWQENEGEQSCELCPAGSRCLTWGISDLAGYECPAGYYCPIGSINGTPCPKGTYDKLQSTGYHELNPDTDMCSLCDATQYCDLQGLLAPTGDCADGFICVEGENDRPGPYATLYTLTYDHDGDAGTPGIPQSGQCPIGSECGSTEVSPAVAPTDCDDILPGYYMPTTQSSECLICPPGSYCKENAVNACDAGSYCSTGSYTRAPRDGEQGDKCNAQHYCSSGSGLSLPCLDDTWQPLEGQSACDDCEKGHVCRNSAKDDCPQDRICDRNSTYIYGHLCDNGFYTDGQSGYDSVSYCNSCDAGYFCMGGQKTGECAAGYICIEEADTHTPDIANKAYPCPMGYYCEPGSSAPQRCPIKTYTFQPGAKQLNECTDCKMGYYCNYDQIEPKICPQGAYCGIGVTEPTWCPRGTYNPIEGMGSPGDCKPCRGGYDCNGRAIGNLLNYPEYICPGGHFCPRGIDIDPIPCIAGSYLPEGGNPAGATASFDEAISTGMGTAASVKDCQLCPEHFYCPRGTADPLESPCPDGYYCPIGSGEPLLCPAGFYCERQGAVTAQLLCPEGNYCPIGSPSPRRCDPNKVCREGSASEFASAMYPEDCEDGEYLSVDSCSPCEPGFVCVSATSQKFPVCSSPRNGQACTPSDGGYDGGYECPAGHYCPGATRSPDQCPPGTYRLQTRGESIDDCLPCPDGSATQNPGSEVCILCGRGSTNNEARTECECVGAFRTWQASLNACVCEQGYIENEITVEGLTSTEDLDCRPDLAPNCLPTQFLDYTDGQCKSPSVCGGPEYCDGAGGEYDDILNGCFCNNLESDPGAFCDSFCEADSLKAYYVPPNDDRLYGYITMALGDNEQNFSLATFENTVMLDGLYCPSVNPRCLIESVKTDPATGQMTSSSEAPQAFINAWFERGLRYDSPYGTQYVPADTQAALDLFGDVEDTQPSLESLLRAQQLHRNFGGRQLSDDELTAFIQNSTTNTTANITLSEQFERRRLIGSDSQPQGNTIFCVEQFGSIAFSVSAENYPVYDVESIYNTDANYDYGLLTKLKTKLITANLDISEFMMTFVDLAQVYVFVDSSNVNSQTIVKVVESVNDDCFGQSRYPITAQNMKLLGIVNNFQAMYPLGGWSYLITPFFIGGAFLLLFWQHIIDSRIERSDAEKRAQKTGIDVKYFKKKSDKFDKLEYIADLYKFISQSLAEIQEQIEENDRLEKEEQKQNMRRMLKNKYSIYTSLDRSTGKDDMEDIDSMFHELLDHLRFSDGRGVREVMEEKKLEEEARKAEEEELARRALDQGDDDAKSVDSFQSDSMISKPSSRGGIRFGADEEEHEDEDNLNIADPQLMDDLVKVRSEMDRKRDDFIHTMDSSLTEDEKADLLAKFDQQMAEMQRQLQRQQEEEDQNLKNRLLARKVKRKQALDAVKENTKEVSEEMTALQEQIQSMQHEHDELCDDDINTHDLKKERNKEFKQRMNEFENENDKRLAQIREDYTKKVAAARDPGDKELILDEMHRRLKSVEDQAADDKKRQEANLMKMLKARQKKQKVAAGRHLGKEIEKLEERVDELQGEVDVEKAKVYAEQGTDNLVDAAILSRKARVADKAIAQDQGFNSELTATEQEDIEITKNTLEIEKQKKLNMAEAAIEEEIDIEQRQYHEEAQATSDKIRRTIAGTDDPEEKARLLAQLAENDRQMKLDRDQEVAAQDRLLQERLKRKRHMMEMRKLKIERDQLDEVNAKEIEINQKKFDKQITEIEKRGHDELDKQLRNTMTRNVSGNEKGLILIDQTHDELLSRKLKILVSKQFFELSKYLVTLQSQIALDRMIKTNEIEANCQKKKSQLVATLRGTQLEDELAKLQAEKHLEHSLIDDKLRQEHLEKESEIRCKYEKTFGDEKKDMQRHEMRIKKEKIQAAMKQYKEDALVQEIGVKMLKRIDNNIDWQMKEIDDNTEKKLEEARLRIVADNEEELRMLQDNLDMAMEKEKVKVEATINARSADVLARKKENLEERLKMVQGDMTEMQIKALRQQMEAEYNAVEKAIEEEKKNQLQKMRGAMLSRRIQKERRRKQEIREKEEIQRRNNLKNMKSGLAKAFTNMIKKKQDEQRQANLQTRAKTLGADSQLEAKLQHWQKENRFRKSQNKQESVLEMESPEDAAAKAKRDADDKAKEEEAQQAQVAGLKYNLEELYKRILKVEKLSEKVRTVHGSGPGGAKVQDSYGLASVLKGNF